MNTNNAAALERLDMVIGSLRNFADVADRCVITEVVNSIPAMRVWAEELSEIRATLAQPDATRPRAIWPDALSSPERHQLRVLLECVDRRVLSLHEADQLVNLIADALTSQPSGEVVAWRVANHPSGPFALRKTMPSGWAVIEPLYTHPSADAPGVAVDEIALAAKSSGLFLSAYYKACESSKPADWHEAAMLAKQWHCRIDEALTAALAPKPDGGHG